MEGLQVARFRGSYRLAAQAINEGIEHSIEKAGGKTRKPADLESILGPAPLKPAMSAFAFPLSDAPISTPQPRAAGGAQHRLHRGVLPSLHLLLRRRFPFRREASRRRDLRLPPPAG